MKAQLRGVGPALLWRYLSYSIMLGLALLNEARPAPHLPDSLLNLIPRIDWVASWNYRLWLLAYLPPALWLWRQDRHAFVHFLYVGGLLSLLRGLSICLTGLGPVVGPDSNAGLPVEQLLSAWVQLINPLAVFFEETAHIYLSKDLFFSGHTATTFLLYLYCRGRPALGILALWAHLLTVAVVFLSHIHYSIDVLGAWAITFSLYTLIERRWPLDQPPS